MSSGAHTTTRLHRRTLSVVATILVSVLLGSLQTHANPAGNAPAVVPIQDSELAKCFSILRFSTGQTAFAGPPIPLQALAQESPKYLSGLEQARNALKEDPALKQFVDQNYTWQSPFLKNLLPKLNWQQRLKLLAFFELDPRAREIHDQENFRFEILHAGNKNWKYSFHKETPVDPKILFPQATEGDQRAAIGLGTILLQKSMPITDDLWAKIPLTPAIKRTIARKQIELAIQNNRLDITNHWLDRAQRENLIPQETHSEFWLRLQAHPDFDWKLLHNKHVDTDTLQQMLRRSLASDPTTVPKIDDRSRTTNFPDFGFRTSDLAFSENYSLPQHEALMRDLETISMGAPNALSAQETALLHQAPKDYHSLSRLFGSIFSYRDNGKPTPTKWADLLQDKLGIQGSSFAENYAKLPNGAKVAMSRALSSMNPSDTKPLLPGVEFDPSVFERANAPALEKFFKALDTLMTSKPEGYRLSLSQQLRKAKSLAPLSLADLRTLTDGLNTSIAHTYINEHGIKAWRGIAQNQALSHSVARLINRYNADPDAQKGIPTLSLLVHHQSKGTFEQLKYDGDPDNVADQAAARKQLAPLSAQQRERWKTPESQILLLDRNGKPVKAPTAAPTQATPRSPLSAEVSALTESWTPSAKPKAFIRDLEALPNNSGNPAEKALRFEGQMAQTSKDKHQKFIKWLLGARDFFKFSEQEISVLQAKVEIQPDMIVVTHRVTNDLTTLLNFGDLVTQHSCQNINCGAHPETVPAVALDANTQLVLSQSLKAGDFPDEDFLKIAEAVSQDSRNIEWDGASATYLVKLPDGRSIRSQPVTRFLQRRILRLGKELNSDEIPTRRPALTYESHYETPNQIQDTLTAEAERMIRSLRRDFKLSPEEVPARFASSRNPSGGYTDRGGGNTVNDFSIFP